MQKAEDDKSKRVNRNSIPEVVAWGTQGSPTSRFSMFAGKTGRVVGRPPNQVLQPNGGNFLRLQGFSDLINHEASLLYELRDNEERWLRSQRWSRWGSIASLAWAPRQKRKAKVLHNHWADQKRFWHVEGKREFESARFW